MTTKPPQPPEGALIEMARKRRGPRPPIKHYAERAGLSDTRWRQIEKGYQTPTAGNPVPVTAQPETLARMARAVDVTPQQLRDVDRDDAADAYEKLFADAGDEPAAPAAEIVDVTELLNDPDWQALVLTVSGAPREQQAALLRVALNTVKAVERERALRGAESADSASESGR